MERFDKNILIILVVVISCVVVWQIRDYLSESCQEKCFDYCDTIGEQVTSINTQLQDLELIYEN